MSKRTRIRTSCPIDVQGEKLSAEYPYGKRRLPIVRLLPLPLEESGKERPVGFMQASQTPFPDVPLTPGSMPPATPHPEVPSTPAPQIPATPRDNVAPLSRGIFDRMAIGPLLRTTQVVREGHMGLKGEAMSLEERRSELWSALISLLLVAILALVPSVILTGR